jgi:signal transduction histidine kinase
LQSRFRATALAEDLTLAREQVVLAREEERRRLRRDLHDGLGPRLAGIGLKAHAARTSLLTEPSRTDRLLSDLRRESTDAADDVRRLVAGLRPPALDVLGLVGAIEEQGRSLSRHPDGSAVVVRVDAADLPELSAATEAAVYRIAVEALTNVSRHSDATSATVALAVEDGRLSLRVTDDGSPTAVWHAGTGLSSMRERVDELGGSCTIGPGNSGGMVSVSFPLRVAARPGLEAGQP